ncbi:UNVERIFIED_ORG: helicase [Bradyrhizobium japonicum]
MRYELPANHGLSEQTLTNQALLPMADGAASLTDIQYEALEKGVARGESVMVSAPTSTGKTLIGWWAIASAMERGGRAVYLVSHRALAKQKFEEAQRLFLGPMFGGDRSAIVCATGDSVEDASGRKTSAPLSATVLVATYEKFLGCMSVGGPPRDLTDTTFVCDEVQLVGDPHRGQNVELLLTLMRRAGWQQFVGLSAVLSDDDATNLASWLNVRSIRNPTREKSLRIQCRSTGSTIEIAVAPLREGDFEERAAGQPREIRQIVAELLRSQERAPVIAFCMKVDDTYGNCRAWVAGRQVTQDVQVPAGLEIDAELLRAINHRAAFHNAELAEEERAFVEHCLGSGLIDVVFATSTLAAGVNFPLGSAVFTAWTRWNFDRNRSEPIGRAEFQNMAGRVGRMGQAADEGLVILTAEGGASLGQARSLMDFRQQDSLGHGIAPEDFGQLILQLFAGKLCFTRTDAFELLASTLSANREAVRGRGNVEHWRAPLERQIDRLVHAGCLIETRDRIGVTAFGLAVARSGLKPETAIYFIEKLVAHRQQLTDLLPHAVDEIQEDDLLFVLAHGALCSPEYGVAGGKATRQIHWRVSRPNLVANEYGRRLAALLFEQPLMADVAAANGALLVTAWAAGRTRQNVEGLVPGVRLGTVEALARDVAWVLTGISEVVAATTSPILAEEMRPEALRIDAPALENVRQLARGLRRQAARISSGLPSDVLWMTSLELAGPSRKLSRAQILALRSEDLTRPVDLMNGDPDADQRRRTALMAVVNPALANQVRDAAKRWKIADRMYLRRGHAKRAALVGADAVVHSLYESRREPLEAAFEAAMEFIAVRVERLDNRRQPAYPDFLITVEDYPSIVVEVKSREADDQFVTLNSATEVLAASELIGMRDRPCLTLCSPGVEPSVPGIIERCARLCVVDVSDLVEAVLRLAEGSLTRAGFYNWLTTPGVALIEDLPHPN